MSGPKRPEYEPLTEGQRLGYLIEEAGEALAAAGKTLRYGLGSYNPELPPHQRESNSAWLRRELMDLLAAIDRMSPVLGGDLLVEYVYARAGGAR